MPKGASWPATQDDADWNGRVAHRQNGHLTPRLIVPLIDRLIALGVLPKPNLDAQEQVENLRRKGWVVNELRTLPGKRRWVRGPNGLRMFVQRPSELLGYVAVRRKGLGVNGVGRVRNDFSPPSHSPSKGAKPGTQAVPTPPGQSPPQSPNNKPPVPPGRGTSRRASELSKTQDVPGSKPGNIQVPKMGGKNRPTQPMGRGDSGKSQTKVISKGGYCVEWPDLDSTGKKDKAAIFLQVVQGLVAYVGGNVESLVPPITMLVNLLGWTEEEANAALDMATQATQQKQDDAQDLADEHGLVPDVPGFKDPKAPPPMPGFPPVGGGKGPPQAGQGPPKPAAGQFQPQATKAGSSPKPVGNVSNSNPEGHNQYTGKEGSVHPALRKLIDSIGNDPSEGEHYFEHPDSARRDVKMIGPFKNAEDAYVLRALMFPNDKVGTGVERHSEEGIRYNIDSPGESELNSFEVVPKGSVHVDQSMFKHGIDADTISNLRDSVRANRGNVRNSVDSPSMRDVDHLERTNLSVNARRGSELLDNVFNPDQPRDERGRFASSGSGEHTPESLHREISDLRESGKMTVAHVKELAAKIQTMKVKDIKKLGKLVGTSPGSGRRGHRLAPGPPSVQVGRRRPSRNTVRTPSHCSTEVQRRRHGRQGSSSVRDDGQGSGRLGRSWGRHVFHRHQLGRMGLG